ncbi:MAG: peptidyl-prolyl cis-trans isomerase [Nitrosomonas sp.]|nr:MAG: peptidyl-prolyl cis-trans isomerase [Nitrosomonas sp.]
MRHHLLIMTLLGVVIFQSPLFAAPSLLGGSSLDKKPIVVNNRILAKVHGKAISVIDVQKKLDVIFYRHFPDLVANPAMRLQFYQVNWRPVLNDLIDKELVLFDARESKIDVTKGDVRQEMEQLFGPNIVSNLDRIGISYEDAREMVEGDLLIRRMMAIRVNIKAQRRVGPRDLRKAYEEYIQTNKRPTEWAYQVITVRHSNTEKGTAAANILHDVLVKNQESIEELAKNYQSISGIDPDIKVTFSEVYNQDENTVSTAYKEILESLHPNSYSDPIAQQSRAKNETVQRIFYVKSMTPGGVVPFAEIENNLNNKLIGEAVSVETDAYLNKLRKDAGLTKENLQQIVPADFQPFVLK